MATKLELPQVEQVKLIEDYNSGLSLRTLETKYSHCRRVLSKFLKEQGIGIRDNTENSRKFHHNEDYFEMIDTEPKAYWLGFLYADGFIDCKSNVGITLSIRDKEHLEKFKACLNADNPIKTYVGSGYAAESEFVRILLKSKKMKQDLIHKGMFENKTLTLEFPTEDQVPEHLLRHFIRGYFDGDGSIWKESVKEVYRIGFTGTENMIVRIRNFFDNQSVIEQKGNAYQVSIGGNKQVIKISHLLYDDSTMYLERKYQKFAELYSKYSES